MTDKPSKPQSGPQSGRRSGPRSGSGADKPRGKRSEGGKPPFKKGGRSGGSRSGGGRSGGNRSGGKPFEREGFKREAKDFRDPRHTPAQVARDAAARAVADTLGKGFRMEGALARNDAWRELEPRDRAFARAIAATTLRRLGQIEGVLAPKLSRNPPGRVRAVLQTAIAQIVFMDIAPHAAVGDAVAIVKSDRRAAPFSGLVNAVLRRVTETGKRDAAAIAPTENIPKWTRGHWARAYGRAGVNRLALELTKTPPLDLFAPHEADQWAEKLGGTRLGTNTVRLPAAGNVVALPGFEDGAWWVQDIAASLPAQVLASVYKAQGRDMSGARVADLCAAPGGKTMQLLAEGAQVTAVDLSEPRLQRLRENLARTGQTAEIIAANIEDWTPEEAFDAVLLDAPCSATGTFRRHPDVLHNRQEKDVTNLTRLQDTLLARAASFVRPGGVLVYAVCSLQPREGAERAAKFNKSLPDFRPIPIQDLPGLSLDPDRFEGGYVRTLPTDLSSDGGMDGFFIAAWTREGGQTDKETRPSHKADPIADAP